MVPEQERKRLNRNEDANADLPVIKTDTRGMDMAEAKHTPGPWTVYAQPISGKADAILESIEQVQATENIASHIYLIDAGGKCAAIAGCGPTSEANARLIAAAPDLLMALTMAGQSAGYQYMTRETRDVIDTAIAKATTSQA